MRVRVRSVGIDPLLIVLSLAGAFLVDQFLVPRDRFVSILFALSVLFAASRVSSRGAILTAVLALSITAIVAGLELGLYIARGIVEAHQGRLWVASTPGARRPLSRSPSLLRGQHDHRVSFQPSLPPTRMNQTSAPSICERRGPMGLISYDKVGSTITGSASTVLDLGCIANTSTM